MSLPPELRALCFQLSNTSTSDLPRLTPTLLRHVARCHVALSSAAGNASKADSSASSVQVQVHKLKTQLSALLNGKSPEGRFAAVVLIKAVVEIGGWEVLRGSEPWVRGLLSILGKPDSAATKELCVVALTKIYCMTHPYQTLVREITTPTLPAFVTSCLNLLSSKSSKAQDASSSTAEVVFRSFATLLPRHTTLFRPFVSQIRAAAKPYVASTLPDGIFVPLSLAESARHLVVLSHLTVAKNAGGEEWGKAVRDLIKDIHVTGDHLFRAVVEDWESAAGYVGEPIDVNAELSGNARDADDLPRWTGIAAGIERIVGLLGLLEEYFKNETFMPVSIPLGPVVDLITRIISIAIPSSSQPSGQGSARLHPAIDGDEKAGLWAGMPQIYVAALKVLSKMEERLQEGFMPLAQGFFDQLAWVFTYGKHETEFRFHAYGLTRQLLLHTGQALAKSSTKKCSMIIKSCCNDLIPIGSPKPALGVDASKKLNGSTSNTNQNADTFLQNNVGMLQETYHDDSDLARAAEALLPLFLSHIPQNYLDMSLRSLIERTAILSHNRNAMLQSILNPFVGKNGKAITSILPHLTREFPDHEMTEILLRPRMPLAPSTGSRSFREEDATLEEDESMQIDGDSFDFVDAHVDQGNNFDTGLHALQNDTPFTQDATENHPGLGNSMLSLPTADAPRQDFFTSLPKHMEVPSSKFHDSMDHQTISSTSEAPPAEPLLGHRIIAESQENPFEARMGENLEADEDSDDESVHLTMELDTDSDDE